MTSALKYSLLMMPKRSPVAHESQVLFVIGFDAEGVRQAEDSGDTCLFRGVEFDERDMFDRGSPVVDLALTISRIVPKAGEPITENLTDTDAKNEKLFAMVAF